MRVARLATPIAVLALALAGCGSGSKVVVKEVPGGSVELTVKGGDSLAPKASPTPTADASATETPEANGTTSGGTAESQTQPQQSATQAPTQQAPTQSTPQSSQGGGATAPESQATPPPGATKQQFETFCQQNPGAC